MTTTATHAMVVRNIDQPDERREPPLARVDVINLAGTTIGHAFFEPGWRWSTSVKPVVGTDSCEVVHTGFLVRGRMGVHMDDGAECELRAGDAFHLPVGHDAWVIGDETVEMLEFSPEAAASYAVPNPR